MVARDQEGIGPRIFHSTWSSPAIGQLADRRLLIFAGGDGVVYAFQPVEAATTADSSVTVSPLQRVWRFDCDPGAPKEDVHRYVRNRRESPSNIKSMPVWHDGCVFVTVGGDIWWGKEEAWLQCIDADGSGDLTSSGLKWSYPLREHCCATPAVHAGLVFVADCGGVLHCVNRADGSAAWTHDLKGETWSSALIADGKVYVGTRRGDWWVFAAQAEKQLLAHLKLPDPVHGTPVAANGTLYVPTQGWLYAVTAESPSRAR
jgi:outer membrane protein assembly factor BamB